ncbi:MAG: HAMP domain-containing histidine kinase [Thiotrichales bacterium]|nr:HAMP domain-containing histidine kinase [Thiotrichales bacterium]
MHNPTTSTAPTKLFNRLLVMGGSLVAIFTALFIVVVVVAEDQMELLSLHHWLDAEASRYERDYQQKGITDAYPNPYEFDFYHSQKSVPAWLSHYQTPGFYEHHLGPEDKHFLVRRAPDGQGFFYVVFKDNADDYLDHYESKLQLFVIGLGSLILLIAALYAYFTLRQIAHPLQQVLQKIRQMPPDFADFSVSNQYQELQQIEQALLHSKRQIADFFRREQEFSRFSAHEIRTPLMVLQGSAELLARLPNPDPRATKAQQRITQSCDEIRLLTDTFLLLGKSRLEAERLELCHLNHLIEKQLAQLPSQHSDGPVFEFLPSSDVWLESPPSFLIIIIRNLLKNAASYSEGTVRIQLDNQQLRMSNPSGSQAHSILKQNQGYGYGLIIVERICNLMNWHFHAQERAEHFEVVWGFSPEKQPTDSQHIDNQH